MARTGVIDAAVIRGKAPLLLGRPTLVRLKMVIDFVQQQANMLGMDKPVNLQTNAAGQLLIDLVQFPSSTKPSAAVSAEALSADSVPGHVAARPSPEQP